MTTTLAQPTAPAAVLPRDLLDDVRAQRQVVTRGEIATLESCLAWAAAHEVADLDRAAYLDGYGEDGLTLAGPGAPLVAESAVTELAAALSMSTDAGAAYLGDALEIRYRLPLLWENVLVGRCPLWRARRIASTTRVLCEDGAEHVDRHLAGFAHAVSWTQLARLVEEALLRWDPEQAETNRHAAAEHRDVALDFRNAGPSGVVDLHGALDLADALDLEAALADRARELGRLGSAESLPVRRSQALGEIARHDATLDFTDHEPTEATATAPTSRPRARRTVVLHVHISTADGAVDGVARVGNTRQPVTAEQARAWCAGAGTVIVRPVLDLAEHRHAASYEVPERMREQYVERDQHCIFPWCTRPAERCDAEHRVPFPAGETETADIAPVCRRHHRHKTSLGWRYTSPTPGTYVWTSPTGLRFLRGPTGTVGLDDPPAPSG